MDTIQTIKGRGVAHRLCPDRGDLIVWLPEEDVVFVGNMLQAPPPAFPWLLDGRYRDTIATYRRLHETVDDETAIVPDRGQLIQRSDILCFIEYIKGLETQIKDAQGRGLTLDPAQRDVRMERYAGYSMYESIHFQVNVPIVYDEVSQSGQ